MQFKIECEVEESYDVVVCGGGSAGFAAALSAARNGAKVALIEQMGYLGGTAIFSGVNIFAPAYHDGERYIIGGIFKELYDELLKYDALIAHFHTWEPFNMETYKLILDKMLSDANVDVYLESSLVSATVVEHRITHLLINTLKGCIALEGKQFIDATGDGYLSMLANVPFEIGRQEDGAIQPYTMMFFVGGVDENVIKDYNRKQLHLTDDGRTYINGNGFRTFIEQANADGFDFIPKKTIGSMYNIPWLSGVVGINFGRIFADANLDPRQLFKDSYVGRLQVKQAVEILQKYIPGFANCQLIESTAKIGRRESRRIIGLYTMTSKDICSQHQFDDVIAQACYQIDIHGPKDNSSTLVWLPKGAHYDVPYRCLVPENCDNLLVAGRCVSATHEALAAIRVQPICIAMGEAAGVAATMCAKANGNPAEIDIAKLKSKLLEQGAILE